MKVDAARLRQTLAARASDCRLYLFHGPDEAGALAAADQVAALLGQGVERVDLEPALLRKEPGRLVDEALSPSLFGDARLIRLVGIGEDTLPALTLLLDAERAGAPVVALAPTLRVAGKVVKLAIASPRAVACGFYEPTPAEAVRIAAVLAHEHGLDADPPTLQRLAELAGNDRAVIAREVEKLALYLDAAAERPRRLDDAALDALGADLGEAAIDELVAAVIDGDPDALGQTLDRLAGGGTSPIVWLRALVRRLMALAAMRAELEGGDPPAAVMKRHRVFAREEARTLAALRRWSPMLLARAIGRARGAERATMTAVSAGGVLAGAAALTLAREAARRR